MFFLESVTVRMLQMLAILRRCLYFLLHDDIVAIVIQDIFDEIGDSIPILVDEHSVFVEDCLLLALECLILIE